MDGVGFVFLYISDCCEYFGKVIKFNIVVDGICFVIVWVGYEEYVIVLVIDIIDGYFNVWIG